MRALDRVEARLQQREDRAPTSGVDRARQGHVKAKVVEDVGVAPTIEVVGLALAQPGAKPLFPLVRARRTTEALERHHRVRRQTIEIQAWRVGDDGNETCERLDD